MTHGERMHVRSFASRWLLAAGGVLAAALLGLAAFGASDATAETYTPHTPSQEVECNLVDNRLAQIPHMGEGPGGWRYNAAGQSFVTFEHQLAGPTYVVRAGRSNVAANTGTFNDYPQFLDLPQAPDPEVLTFEGRHGQIVLGGGALFQLPGQDDGRIIINVTDPNRDGTYEGCAKTPFLTNFGFLRPEGGDFVQRDLFKGYAETLPDGTVDFYEWTEVSTFKDTTGSPGQD